ncbi:uncharacterized protein J4E84_010231 [Alternaria hordeiaustralica]|uniref:uncharacterized protein n=1 Tax=Alternaria hordeiaustralica TaxID=1187925 RepID=UPI0020C4D469|nr:uncharacterized protein J4E84_010231 [Alternaria hordeiaustralica]KAI4675230.1 hypothetical protein J4E84_010231 [Alternaria hordeiaustralica]
MELPDELYLEIFSHLPQHHLRSVSQTCRAFATIVRPLMFATIHLDGSPQSRFGRMENNECVMYPGRSRTVELVSLESTVDELIAHDIARHVRKLKFSPKYYVDGFWSRYRHWLEREQDYEEDFHRMYDEEDFETDSEGEYAGIRRLAAERLARPDRERELIEQAEAIWAAKVEEQRVRADAVLAAMVKLFAHMPCLKAIEVQEWHCDLGDYGFEEGGDDEVDEQFSGCGTTWKHLELLCSAVQASNSRIQSLVLPKIDPSSITTSAALEHMFSSLTALSFNAESVDFMLDSSNNEAESLAALIRCSSETLQTLEFRNMTTSHPQLPDVGEHYIARLLGSVTATDSADITPLVFPALTTLKLRSLVLDTPSLITFLSRQPRLRYARFEYIYLATVGYKWGDVAEKLPSSCNRLYIGNSGHEKWGPDSPAAYNHIKKFLPFQDDMPATSGWRLNDAAFQKEMDDEIQRNMDGGMRFLPRERWFQGKTKEEWVDMMRMASEHAEFERI